MQNKKHNTSGTPKAIHARKLIEMPCSFAIRTNVTFVGVPTSVPSPPMLDEYAMPSITQVAKLRHNTSGDSFSPTSDFAP